MVLFSSVYKDGEFANGINTGLNCTIPVTNYPHWFSPELTHMVDCVAFSSLNELMDVMQTILAMSEQTIAQLRQDTISYYDTFLEPGAFMDRLLGTSQREVTMHVLVEDEMILRRAASLPGL